MKESNNSKKMLIIGIVIGLIIGGIAGYFINQTISKGRFSQRNNFQISEEQKNEVTQIFESTSDINEITQYCSDNRMNCAYYCRTINPSDEICSSIMNQTLRGGRPA